MAEYNNHGNFSQFGSAQPDAAASDKALDWDSEIADTGKNYIILKPGVYDFTVTKFERGHHAGSAKIPPCNKATLGLVIHGGEQGDGYATTNLFLTENQAWTIAQFFVSIGQMEKGGKLKMNWSHVIGATGRLELANREYNGKMYNDVRKFLPPLQDKPAGAAGYKAGTF